MRNSTRAAFVALFALLATGCSTTQYRQALLDRDAEIRSLREERTQLKNQLRDQRTQTESLETALAEANKRRNEMPIIPARTQEPSFPELESLGITTEQRGGNLVITVPSQITFASGKAELTSNGRQAIAAVAATLKRNYPDATYWIEGHTDSDPIKKSRFPTNRDLSLARAMAVLHSLVGEAGIDDGKCVVTGWGEYQPLAANDSDKNKARNRRVEIIVNRR